MARDTTYGGGQFVALSHELLTSYAWRALSCCAQVTFLHWRKKLDVATVRGDLIADRYIEFGPRDVQDLGEKTVRRALLELQRVGLIVRSRRRQGENGSRALYRSDTAWRRATPSRIAAAEELQLAAQRLHSRLHRKTKANQKPTQTDMFRDCNTTAEEGRATLNKNSPTPPRSTEDHGGSSLEGHVAG